MEIKVYCHNCKTEILRANTETLKTPLAGHMFRVKKDMEWSMFSPSDTGFDLTCPMCEWTFHDNGKVLITTEGGFVFGLPEEIISLTDETQEEVVKIEIEPELVTENVIAPPINVSNPTLEAIQKQVEDSQTEERAEVPPEIASIQDIVEGSPDGLSKEPEKPELNQGDWGKIVGVDEESEMNGDAPPGTVTKLLDALKRGGRPKGSKNKGKKYRDARAKKSKKAR